MTLTEFNYTFKKFIKFSIIVLILYFVGKAGVIYTIKKLTPVPPPPPPQIGFGKIKPIKLYSLPLSKNAAPEYLLDTKTGKLPEFNDRIELYKTKPPLATILSEKRTRDIAIKLGFTSNPVQVSTTEFVWENSNERMKMTANTVLNNYKLTFDLIRPPSSVSSRKALAEKKAQDAALKFLDFIGLSHPDLVNAKKRVSYLILENGIYRTAQENESAHFSRVDFVRSIGKKEDIKIFNSQPNFSLISVYVTNNGKENVIPQFEYTYWDYDTEKGSTYPLLDVNSAWSNVISGNGILASLIEEGKNEYSSYTPPEISRLEIRDVELIYIEIPNYFEVLQPFYIFTGISKDIYNLQGNFIIYYPALSADQILLDTN